MFFLIGYNRMFTVRLIFFCGSFEFANSIQNTASMHWTIDELLI
jgi:hypothetical protein